MLMLSAYSWQSELQRCPGCGHSHTKWKCVKGNGDDWGKDCVGLQPVGCVFASGLVHAEAQWAVQPKLGFPSPPNFYCLWYFQKVNNVEAVRPTLHSKKTNKLEVLPQAAAQQWNSNDTARHCHKFLSPSLFSTYTGSGWKCWKCCAL